MVQSFLTFFRLGPLNILTVLIYKLSIRFRLARKILPLKSGYNNPLCNPFPILDKVSLSDPSLKNSILNKADEILNGKISFFSKSSLKTEFPPDWFINPFTGKRFPNADLHWSVSGDFESDFGDIKTIWEISKKLK